MANKAPAGYGLGETAGKLLTSSDDLNAVFAGGWYKWTTSSLPANTPEATSGALEVIPFSSVITIQKYCQLGTKGMINYCAIRQIWGSQFGEWEWVNPPMLLGVEYRTTERYLGKPVYAKLVDCGALPNGTIKTIAHGEQVLNAISCTLELTSTSGNHSTAPEINSDNTVSVFAQLSPGNIIIMANRDFCTYNAVAKIKYTKSSD